MAIEETLEEVLQEVRDSWLAAVHTALPGRVVRYDTDKQTADVQPQVKDIAFDEEGAAVTRSFPLLVNVPICFARGGGAFVGMPIKAGDTGLLVFSQLPIDRWRANGKESDPADNRRHSLTSAVFFPGLSPKANVIAELSSNADFVAGFEGGNTIRVTESGDIKIGTNAAQLVALANLVATELNRVKSDLTSLKAAIAGAATVPNDGGAAFKTNILNSLSAFPSSPSSVAASKVKAE